MAGIASTEVGGYWVSTITLDDLPYTQKDDNNYETAVFYDRDPNKGAVAHTERCNNALQAVKTHDRIVSEITAGTFEGNGESWGTMFGIK